MRAGYSGHLTLISNKLLATAAARPLVSERLDNHPDWQEFAAGRLAKANQVRSGMQIWNQVCVSEVVHCARLNLTARCSWRMWAPGSAAGRSWAALEGTVTMTTACMVARHPAAGLGAS